MSDPSLEQRRLPFIYAQGRSAVDPTRLRWSGVGNAILAMFFMFGSHSGALGVIVGLLIIALGLATWIITGFGRRQWYSIPPNARAVAATGAIIGVAMTYLVFGIFFLIIWVIRLFT
jgi:hypothetical protein